MIQHRAGPGLLTWHFGIDGPGVLAMVTTRSGGVSTGPYEGLNLAYHVGDDPDRVATNRNLVVGAFDLPFLTVPDQQHGNRVAVVDGAVAGAGFASQADAEARLGATDALVTDAPDVPLAVMVADCAPVVLFDPSHRALGVAHAGRRGAVLDVVGATVSAMAGAFGTDPADLHAGIGPCIGQANYEIGGDQLDETQEAFGNDLLAPTRPGHAGFDLLGAVRWRLQAAGVPPDHVEAAGTDTYTSSDLFSDRAHRPCGRFMLVAALRPAGPGRAGPR